MDLIRDWIANIIVVIVISIFVEIIMPNNNFRKYSKLVMGIIIMIMIIKPVLKISDSEQLLNKINIESLEYIDKTQISEQSNIMEEKQTQQIIDTYKQSMKEHVMQKVRSISGEEYNIQANVEIDSNTTSSDFGTLENIEVILLQQQDKSIILEVEPIKTTNISLNSKDDNVKVTDSDFNKGENVYDSQLKSKIIESLHNTYNMPRENIKIKIQKSKDKEEKSGHN